MYMKMLVARDVLRRNLVFRRAKSRLSQVALAQRAGISRPLFSEIEQGRANVSLDVVDRLASALDTTVAQLLEPLRRGSSDEDLARRADDGDDAFVYASDLFAALDDRAASKKTGHRYFNQGRKPAKSS